MMLQASVWWSAVKPVTCRRLLSLYLFTEYGTISIFEGRRLLNEHKPVVDVRCDCGGDVWEPWAGWHLPAPALTPGLLRQRAQGDDSHNAGHSVTCCGEGLTVDTAAVGCPCENGDGVQELEPFIWHLAICWVAIFWRNWRRALINVD